MEASEQCRCGALYIKDKPWKRLCIDCWIKEKNAEKAREARNERARERYQREKTCKKPQSIPQEMLRTLISLCHPDRHGGKDSATRATQFLLSLRGK